MSCPFSDNEGFGFGTPAQRQKQHQKLRAMKASEAVYEHKMGKVIGESEDRLVTLERNRVKKQQVNFSTFPFFDVLSHFTD